MAEKPKKALFLLIDAMRYDVLSDPVARRFLFPNMARLIDRGFVRRVVTNAQSTQFVMPSLFSLSYPLDYDGYNNGIRNRPKSFVESLRDAGFETHLMSSCNQLGITLGYERGFDTLGATADFRTQLEQRIHRNLKYEIDLWKRGERSEVDAIAIVQREFGLLLDRVSTAIGDHDKRIWPPRLRRINDGIHDGAVAEKKLLEEEPLFVMRRLSAIPAGVYWRVLGRRRFNPIIFGFNRLVTAISWRLSKFISSRTFLPLLPLTHFQVVAGEIIAPICRFLEDNRDRNWFVHMHIMDAHDCRSIGRPLHVLGRLRYLPRWLVARVRGLTRRRWTYDSALLYVDHQLGKLFSTLERTGQLDDTLILVTADHANQYAESPRKKISVGFRTYYEDIEVPLVMAGTDKRPSDVGLIDSMGVTASLLDGLGVPLHASYKGLSAFGPGREAVISESCGAGNADLLRRDIYFTVTGQSHKLMTVLRGDRLDVEKLFDLRADPREEHDLVGEPGNAEAIEDLLAQLHRERGELLARRGVLDPAMRKAG